MANDSPKSVQRNPDKHAIDHIGKENPKNIGTGTVDYWLCSMDQKLRAAFGD